MLAILGMSTHHQHHVVPLDPSDNVKIGDRLLTNIRACGVPFRSKDK